MSKSMGKRCLVCWLLLAALLLCGCEFAPLDDGTGVTQGNMESIYTDPTQATTETTEPTQGETEPPHSDLYLPEVTTQQMLKFFSEVVLDVEYSDGTGDASLVQKWTSPIYYQYYGTPTEEDRAVLEGLFAQLNQIPGFPGIYEAENPMMQNLSLNFLEADAFRDSFSSVVNGEDAYGATQFWYYTATNQIYNARIGYRTDLDQTTRSSILIEEIINTLGITDTVLRTDSIVYQYSNTNLSLSDVDWVILKLLYNPAIECGMGADRCTEIIESLYY